LRFAKISAHPRFDIEPLSVEKTLRVAHGNQTRISQLSRLLTQLFLLTLALHSLGTSASPTCIGIEAQRSGQVIATAAEIANGRADSALRTIFAARDKQALLSIVRAGTAERKALAEWIQGQFQRDRESILGMLSYNDALNPTLSIKTVIVGAGIHASGLAGELATLAPNRKAMEGVLIIDEAPNAISTFYGKSFRINSPEFASASSNEIPSALVQLKEFQAGAGIVEASDLALVGLINLYASGAKVLLATSVTSIRPSGSGASVTIQANQRDIVVRADSVGIATGAGGPSFKHFTDPTVRTTVETETARTSKSTALSNGVYWYADFLRIWSQRATALGAQVSSEVAGKDVIIVGPGHSGFISAEPFMGEISAPNDGGIVPRSAKSVQLVGIKVSSVAEFTQSITPKSGTPEFKQSIINRYLSRGIGAAIEDGYIRFVGGRVNRVEKLANGRTRLTTADGKVMEGDIIILSTGHQVQTEMEALLGQRQVFQPPQGTGQYLEVQYGAVQRAGSGQPTQIEAVSRRLQTMDAAGNTRPTRIVVFGAAADLPKEPQALAQTITGNPVSINYLAPKDTAVAREFANWLGWPAAAPR
jgi:hypothetical protein